MNPENLCDSYSRTEPGVTLVTIGDDPDVGTDEAAAEFDMQQIALSKTALAGCAGPVEPRVGSPSHQRPELRTCRESSRNETQPSRCVELLRKQLDDVWVLAFQGISRHDPRPGRVGVCPGVSTLHRTP